MSCPHCGSLKTWEDPHPLHGAALRCHTCNRWIKWLGKKGHTKMKIAVETFEPHPIGCFNVAISGPPEECVSGTGPYLKWPLESPERTEEGQPYPLSLLTSCSVSAKSKLGLLIAACGLQVPKPGEEFDTDDLVGKVIQVLVSHVSTDKGVFARVVDVQPKAKGKVGKAPKEDKSVSDPFTDE